MSTEEILHLDDEVQIAVCFKEFQSRGVPTDHVSDLFPHLAIHQH